MSEKHLTKHVYSFNKEDNGGEQFTITTDFYDNGDGVRDGLFLTHEIGLQSYGNSASINLGGVELTPTKLRKLANELDAILVRLKAGLDTD